jgi:hypothetical protein
VAIGFGASVGVMIGTLTDVAGDNGVGTAADAKATGVADSDGEMVGVALISTIAGCEGKGVTIEAAGSLA